MFRVRWLVGALAFSCALGGCAGAPADEDKPSVSARSSAAPTAVRAPIPADCQPAVKSDAERALDLGACDADGARASELPALSAYGWKTEDIWCSSGPMEHCAHDELSCECLFGGCGPAVSAHCFEIAACVDGRVKSELTCYRTAKDCEKNRPLFGMEGATCHVLGSGEARAPSK